MLFRNGFTLTSPLLLLCSFLLCAGLASCGSLCPPRKNIYPCSCLNVQLNKRTTHTTVICHRLKDSTSLDAIFPALKAMLVDKFHLVDSFWGAGEGQKSLPVDWLSLLKVKEMEIVDTELDPCFACQWKFQCKNIVTTRFTAVNSTRGESLCTLCDTGKGGKFPWTSCLGRLKHFHLSHGTLTSLGADAFPFEMRELSVLNLTHNRINRVDPKALVNLTRLVSLDLSHNAIEHVHFVKQATHLKFLDLSWNYIKTIGPIFVHLPSLETLKAESNNIIVLKEGDWKNVPGSLRYIDLSDNPLHCDCGVRFVNETFHPRSKVLGSCSTPAEYENKALLKTSRLLNKNCDEEGNIITKTKLVTLALPRRTGWPHDGEEMNGLENDDMDF